MNDVLRFSLTLIALLLASLGIQLLILYSLGEPLFENRILLAYFFNYMLAVLIYAGLYFLKERFTAQIGFLYMGGSLLKFLLFFAIFYPFYKLDGTMSRAEFAAFFVPYAICLILETSGIIKFLKK